MGKKKSEGGRDSVALSSFKVPGHFFAVRLSCPYKQRCPKCKGCPDCAKLVLTKKGDKKVRKAHVLALDEDNAALMGASCVVVPLSKKNHGLFKLSLWEQQRIREIRQSLFTSGDRKILQDVIYCTFIRDHRPITERTLTWPAPLLEETEKKSSDHNGHGNNPFVPEDD